MSGWAIKLSQTPFCSAARTVTGHVLVTRDEPTSGLRVPGNVITIFLIAVFIPIRRLNRLLTIVTDEIQDCVGIRIVVVIRFHESHIAEQAASGAPDL